MTHMPSIQNKYLFRSQCLQACRSFFKQQGFYEIDTPIAITANAPELYINPLTVAITENDTPQTKQLHTSPELAMKKIMAHGHYPIYQLCHVFRDNDWTRLHRPEFTMLEWYHPQADYELLFSVTENLIRHMVKYVTNTSNLYYQQQEIDITLPFLRFSLDELFIKYCNIKISDYSRNNLPIDHAQSMLHKSCADYSYDDIFHHLFLEYIQPQLNILRQPYFLYDYPASLASLARLDPDNASIAQRVELYLGEWELANGFVELIDAGQQRVRFQQEMLLREKMGKPQFDLDEQFLNLLERCPPATGNALGFDRLIMAMAGKEDIKDVMCFPM